MKPSQIYELLSYEREGDDVVVFGEMLNEKPREVYRATLGRCAFDGSPLPEAWSADRFWESRKVQETAADGSQVELIRWGQRGP